MYKGGRPYIGQEAPRQVAGQAVRDQVTRDKGYAILKGYRTAVSWMQGTLVTLLPPQRSGDPYRERMVLGVK